MKVAVKKFVGHTEKEASAGLLKLSIYYHFSFRFCNVRKGNEKGHVERSVEYIRRKAFARKDKFSSLAQANDYLEDLCDSLNEKPKKENDGKTASLLLQEEQVYFYPLKPMFECGEDHTFKVDKYSTITYKTCRYSVPEKYVGKFITSKVYPEKIICRAGEETLCVHTRLTGLHEWSIQIEHYTQTLRRKPGAIAGSLAMAQIDSRLEQIYKMYYLNREKEFIDLIDYIKKPSITIETIELAIKHLNPVKTTDVTLDKIKIVCDRNDDNTEILYHRINEIDEMCYAQLKALARLFPENITLSREITEVI
jgi:hypothetical protein